jgi:hypothetical protein
VKRPKNCNQRNNPYPTHLEKDSPDIPETGQTTLLSKPKPRGRKLTRSRYLSAAKKQSRQEGNNIPQAKQKGVKKERTKDKEAEKMILFFLLSVSNVHRLTYLLVLALFRPLFYDFLFHSHTCEKT